VVFAAVLAFAPAASAALNPQLSYYPSDFYAHLDEGLKDSALKAELFKILSSGHERGSDHDKLVAHCPAGEDGCVEHTSLGYNTARRILFGEIHLRKTSQGYAVFDVYCETLKTRDDFRHDPPGPDQIPDPNVLNAEHTWPQSHFSAKFNKALQKSDLHILYPVASGANSSRGNLDFSNVVTPVDGPCPKAKRGYGADGSGQTYFEPPDAHKGNVARAIFYFSIRYKMPVPLEEETSLKAWNRLDPVDDFERGRNEAIADKQHDRNPFIDYPELVDRISDF
jgi:hypothetical protein